MRKSTRIVKRVLALFLVVLMSINTLGAVVSDNDGSAFITKAEFDSLKNNFQSQIDQYNTSIDSKIDGAIASYLAGINITKNTNIEPLVSNYADIMWTNDLRFYGGYIRFTSSSNREHFSNNYEWYVPYLGERRMQICNRAGIGLQIWDTWQENNYSKAAYDIKCDITAFDGITYSSNWSVDNLDGNLSFPVCCVHLKLDASTNEYIINRGEPFLNVEGLQHVLQTQPHKPNANPNQFTNAWWHAEGMPYSISSFQFNAVSGNELLNYTTKINNAWGGGASVEVHTVKSTLDLSNTLFPQFSYVHPISMASGQPINKRWSDYQSSPDKSGKGNSNWYHDGVTINGIDGDTYTRQILAVGNMFLGKDSTLLVNVLKPQVGRAPMNTTYDVSDIEGSSGYGTLSIKSAREFFAANYGTYSSGAAAAQTYQSTGTFKVPYLPRAYFRNLSSGKFVYNNKNIKIGEGLILVNAIDKKGDLKITFDYNIGNIINDTSYTTGQDLYFDLKKGNFLSTATNDSEYFTGYEGDVDPDRTTTTANLFKNYKYSTKTGKVSLTVPIEKDESMYIRLHPSNETGGYYVKISNLKIIHESDG